MSEQPDQGPDEDRAPDDYFLDPGEADQEEVESADKVGEPDPGQPVPPGEGE